MAIDTSIYGGIGDVKQVDTGGFADAMGKGLNLSNLAMQNRQARQAQADQDSVRSALMRNMGQDGQLNKQGVLSDLAKSAPMQAMDYQGKFAEQDAKQADYKQKVLQDNLNKGATAYRMASAVKSPEDYAKMKQQIQAMGLPVDHLPEEFDPAHINDLKMKSAMMTMDAKQGLDALKGTSEIGINEAKAPLERGEIVAKTNHLNAETGQLGGGKPLAAEQSDKLAGHEASMHMIDDLRNTIASNKDSFGPISGRLASLNPYNARGQEVSALFKKASQTIGKSLEGGKLTDQDYAKYQKMLPNQNDTPDVANAKLDQLERMVTSQRNADLDTYGKAGSNVKRFAMTTPPDIAVAHPKLAGPSGGLGVREANASSGPTQPGMIRMIDPKGNVRMIPESQKGEAIAAGGRLAK